MKKAITLALGALLLSSCTVRVADLIVVSIKNYNLNGGKFYKGKRVTAEGSYPVTILPPGIPNVKAAVGRVIEKDRCVVGLSSIVVTQLNHSFLSGRIGLRAENSLVIDHSLPGCESAS